MSISDKVIITCAVTGSIHTPSMSPHLPVTAEEIVESAVGAADAGAAILHLHARDPATGRPDQSPSAFAPILGALAERTDAVLNLTTGGAPTMSVAERIEPVVAFQPELASMNMGSMNFGLYPMLDRYSQFQHDWEADYLENSRANIFRNSLADIEHAMKACGAGGTRFEFECYDIGHLYTLAHFVARGLVSPPFFVQSVFGLLGGIGNHGEDINHMRRTADRLFGEDYQWSVLGAGRHQMRVAAAGLTLGGNIRVGLEDNLWAGKGRLSVSNREQVETARKLVESLGLSVASPEEARAILGLKGRAKNRFSKEKETV
ncbi:BKACE family enzyme [Mameliella alba]|uniref:3-keto-5-aminohexanoate cleavage protein n=1 Tax=Mameliella alba TaxID=561184 RepID=UPI000B537320|nr:3-keto-5-aminohexanoate cleavage protein [Mameliella alba]OWV46254.1 3-keto-5-aminohexanoate cleavage protein [Mameliella alba]GGF74863.1 3-keto-5-aminohexanoate cleavage protein [Mameliella alba]